MKVLVVGGAGYVGGAVTDILSRTQHEVLVYDSLVFEETYLKDTPFVLGDIRDRDLLGKYLSCADAVIWLSAMVGDGACALHPETTREINEESVRWLAETFEGRIAFPSTCSVYGARTALCDETSPLNPLSLYAQSKLAAEKSLHHSNAIIFRLGTLFGISDTYARLRSDLVVNTLTIRAVTEHRLRVFGGTQFRPLLHVRDAAQAIVDSLEINQTGIFNLHKENSSVHDIARQVKALVPDVEIETDDLMFQDTRTYRVSSAKARLHLGFAPLLDVSDGIMEVKRIIAGRRVKDPNNCRYHNAEYLRAINSSV
ncbi:NAD-dependent epimerase/dehydratase family protein [Streptomyces sp. NPDC056437]|uniref:NAD-dependent epimerase/dehydratase family protein n=1 Tax=Streptomyces sp. NPDC056437 TaxID=3345816 RepID=UPI0036817050